MCNADFENVRDRLMNEVELGPIWATLYATRNGRCEYCKRDLIHDRLGYACAEIDHLLSQAGLAKHGIDQQITDSPENFVLSCSLCNNLKGQHWILLNGEDPWRMLTHHRRELIERVRQHIGPIAEERDQAWMNAREIVLGVNRH